MVNLGGDSTRESDVEKELKKRLMRIGYLSLKFVSVGVAGVPDQLVIGHNDIHFVELKTTNGKPSARQQWVHKLLRKYGATVYVVAGTEEIEPYINKLKSELRHDF